MSKACEPGLGAIFSKPCIAQEAGSINVASTSLKLLILNRRPRGYEHCACVSESLEAIRGLAVNERIRRIRHRGQAHRGP